MKLKFSIIVVCYNAGKKLFETVNSILEQTYSDYEIIIKDGLSSDDSLQTLPEDKRIRVFSCADRGIYDAMNQAVKEAGGAYYLFLNCGDSFYEADVLEKTAAQIEGGVRTLIYYGNTYNKTSESFVGMPHTITPFTCYRHIPCHQACFYAKELFEKRLYDLSYRVRADYEHFLWCYFRMHATPQFLNITVANYEGGGFSETKENRQIDKKEHRSITRQYMSKAQALGYRTVMLLTLAPLRSFISRQKGLSVLYNKIKGICYR